MLEVRDLQKSFGAIDAVRGVSFRVGKGEILGFLGPNGAGKSTTMRMITGFLPPTAGTALIEGFDIREQPVEARRRLGYLPENAPSYGEMSAVEFLDFIAGIRGFHGEERRHRVATAMTNCRLESVRNQPIETLSKGYRQRVCFAQALLHDPPLLILDEPTDGLDPNQKHAVREMIRGMAREKAIIISTHILEEVEALCTRVIIIHDGRVVAEDTPERLKARHPTGRLDEVFRQLTGGGAA